MRKAVQGPSDLALAFQQPLNYLMLGTVGLSALMSQSPLTFVLGGIAELVWLFGLSRTEAQRRQFQAIRERAGARSGVRSEQARLRGLPDSDRQRFLALDRVRQEIRRLIAQNDSLGAEMMVPELVKMDRLTEDFLGLLQSRARMDAILAGTDLNALSESLAEAEVQAEGGDASQVSKAGTLRERYQQAKQLAEKRGALENELEAVESGFQLLRGQAAQMTASDDLSRGLESLMAGVRAVEETQKELNAMSLDAAASQVSQRN